MMEATMKKRYSIWGRMYGADHDTEIVQVETNPQAMLDALINKKLTVRHSIEKGGKMGRVRMYDYLRFVENAKRD
jgi:hypothetical protein